MISTFFSPCPCGRAIRLHASRMRRLNRFRATAFIDGLLTTNATLARGALGSSRMRYTHPMCLPEILVPRRKTSRNRLRPRRNSGFVRRPWAEGRGSGLIAHGELMTAFRSASGEHFPTIFRFHTRSKAVLVPSLTQTRLECALQGILLMIRGRTKRGLPSSQSSWQTQKLRFRKKVKKLCQKNKENLGGPGFPLALRSNSSYNAIVPPDPFLC